MDGFKVWLMNSPLADFQGYWNGMRELAEWTDHLAHCQKRSFKLIDGFMNIVCNHRRELPHTFPDLTDDTDLDARELFKIWLSEQGGQKGEELIVDSVIKQMMIDDVMSVNPRVLMREQHQETLRQLDQLGKS
jgi:hypothetical protein